MLTLTELDFLRRRVTRLRRAIRAHQFDTNNNYAILRHLKLWHAIDDVHDENDRLPIIMITSDPEVDRLSLEDLRAEAQRLSTAIQTHCVSFKNEAADITLYRTLSSLLATA